MPPTIVCLFDVDNTLLDNDQVIADLEAHLLQEIGPARARGYWTHFEQIRQELGYADYLGALQRYRLAYPHDLHVLTVSRFLVNYPFAERLFPKALEVLAHVSQSAQTVILSDGDVVFQPRKIEQSGILQAVDGHALIYVHKEQALDDVERRYPAEHYLLVDDKLRILTSVKQGWKTRVTTVFARQGHYAHEADAAGTFPQPDLTIDRIGDLLACDPEQLVAGKRQS